MVKKKISFIQIILEHTIQQWKILWQTRNDIVHSNDHNSRTSERKSRVHAELAHIYKRKEEYLSKDRDILFKTLEEHQELPVSSIQNWLILYKSYLRESAATAKKLAIQHVRNIKEYFSFK